MGTRMKTNHGFTLIELMIVIAIGFIIVIAVFGFFAVSQNGSSNVSMGINGLTESRCIDGYKFIIGQRGFPQQVIGDNGGGVKCEGM
jgi:type II secretory pathway pseudopilin PulG